MKLSNYNYFFTWNDCEFIYNSLSDHFIKISSTIKDLLYHRNFNQIDEKTQNILKETRVIVSNHSEETQLLENEYNYDKIAGNYEIVVLPTLNCNVSCWYCFEKHQEHTRLSPIITDAIIAHLTNIINSKPEVNFITIQFFGGEPLMYFKNDVYPLIDKLRAFEKLGKHIHFLFVTNGICLTDEIINYIKDLDVYFQISIDGCKSKHDSVKRQKEAPNSSTFDIVMNNINRVIKETHANINLRINYDNQTIHHVCEIIPYIASIPRDRINIHFERVWQTIESHSEINNELIDVFERFIQDGFVIDYSSLYRRKHSCRSERYNHVVISYDGSVYKCTGRDFSDEQKVGVLRTDGSIKWDYAKLENRVLIKTYDNESCKSCKLLPLCWGPCSQKQIEMKKGNFSKLCPKSNMELSLENFLIYTMRSRMNKNLI
jgi:uncharacterized protein